MIIYHNNRCKKSREALNLLLNKKIDVQVIEYLKNGVTVNEIKILLEKLKLNPIEIVRKKEEEINKLEGDKKKIEWGSQISNYVLHPYKLVKD